MSRFVGLLLVLTGAGLAVADPPTVPAKIEATVLQMKRIEVTPSGDKEIGYQLVADADSVFFDELVSREGKRRFVFQATRPGTFAVVFWSKDELVGTVCTVVVAEAAKPGGGGPKPPPPPPESDGLTRIRADYKALIEAVKAIPADAAVRTALGAAYLDLAAKIQAGALNDLNAVTAAVNAKYIAPPLSEPPAQTLILAVAVPFTRAVGHSPAVAELRRAYIAAADALGVPVSSK